MTVTNPCKIFAEIGRKVKLLIKHINYNLQGLSKEMKSIINRTVPQAPRYQVLPYSILFLTGLMAFRRLREKNAKAQPTS